MCQKINDYYFPILFHSRKLNRFQRKHTKSDKELLSIVYVLIEHRNLPLGMKIVVFTDHKDVTRENTLHTRSRVQRHRLIIEEYRAHLECVEGVNNDMGD